MRRSPAADDETILRKIWNDPIHLILSLWKSHGIPFHEGLTVHYRGPVMNEKLPIEFKEREKEKTSSTRNRFPRMDHGGVPSVSREPVHRYQRKTPVSSSLFSRTRPRGRGRIAWRICHVCPVLPFPRVASGIEEHPWLWCKRSCRIESTLFSLSLWNREKVRRAVLGRDGRSFEWKVREERGMIAPQAMIRHTHIRIYDFRTCPPEGLFIGGHESLPSLSVSLSRDTPNG